MTTETTVHNIRLSVDRLAKEIAVRVMKDGHDQETYDKVYRHARETIVDWLLGDFIPGGD
jgi:hypothetical protein